MGSPEVVSRVKELTTPPQGEGDVSYALVVHSNKGSYEPTWYTGINDYKAKCTPNGVFENSASSGMYAIKKYCEAGDVQLLVVRPKTGALMSGLKVFNRVPNIAFNNIGVTGTAINIGDAITYKKQSYVCRKATVVPQTIQANWLTENFIELNPSGSTSEAIINFSTTLGFHEGTTLKFTGDPNTATFAGATTYPAYMIATPHVPVQENDIVFGWFNNDGTEWKFGYALYNGNTFVVDTEVKPEADGSYILPKDIVSGGSAFWTFSEQGLVNNYEYLTNIQLLTNTESYDDLKNSGLFPTLPAVGTSFAVGQTLWYGDIPYVCKIATTVPQDVTSAWINYYFTSVGHLTSANYEAWSQGVTDIEEYTQEDDELLTFYASNGGKWGDGLAISVLNYADDPDEIEVEGCFKVTFFENGSEIESYIVSRKLGLLDANGNSMYIEDVINTRSDDFRVKDNTLLPDDLLPDTQLNAVIFGGGANGAYPTDSDMITALNKMQDESVYPYLILGDGGYTTVNFAKAIQSVVNQRKGTKGSICVPQVASVASSMSKAYSNISEYMVSLNMSDEKMRVEEYWSREFDPDTGRTVLIPPDGLYARNEVLTKRNEGLYYPNAGWTNGAIDTDLVNKWDKGYRDLLDKIKVNYCKYDKSKGSCIFSEQTTLGRPSYLQQDHIMKVLLDIIPKHEALLENYLLRLSEDGVFNQITFDLNQSMDLVVSGHGASWYEVTCGKVNNSQATLDAQEVNVWVEFQPINSIKKITITYGLTNQSVRLVDVQG